MKAFRNSVQSFDVRTEKKFDSKTINAQNSSIQDKSIDVSLLNGELKIIPH